MVEVEKLIMRIANEDEIAFNELFSQYWSRIYNYTYSFCKSGQIARETTQDVFVKIWYKRKLLSEVSNFDNYVFAIVRNTVIDNIKSNLKVIVSLDNMEINFSEENNRPDLQYSAKELQKRLGDIIETLPPARKNVFKLHRIDGKTYEEIAQILNISKNTVKEHIKLSLKHIRLFLHSDGLALLLMALLVIYF